MPKDKGDEVFKRVFSGTSRDDADSDGESWASELHGRVWLGSLVEKVLLSFGVRVADSTSADDLDAIKSPCTVDPDEWQDPAVSWESFGVVNKNEGDDAKRPSGFESSMEAFVGDSPASIEGEAIVDRIARMGTAQSMRSMMLIGLRLIDSS